MKVRLRGDVRRTLLPLLLIPLILTLVNGSFLPSIPITQAAPPAYEIEIECPDYWQVTYPGNVLTFNLLMRNPGLIYDDYLLYIDDPPLPENWTAAFYLGNKMVRGLGLRPKQSINLVLEVRVPEDAAPGDYQFTVYINGTYTVAKRTLMVTVEPIPKLYKIDLYSPVTWQVTYPGKNLTFNLQIKNLSPYRDDYFIYVNNPPLPENWTANFYIQSVKAKSFSVLPQEAIPLTLIIHVPEDAEPNDYRFRVQIEGNYASASHALTVTVEEPPSIRRQINLTTPFPMRSILTGQNASYPVKVENWGEVIERIFLEANMTSEMMYWEASFSQTQLVVDAGSGEWVMFTVRPPEIVKAGDYQVNVTASTEDGELRVTLPLMIRVFADYRLEITGIQPINPQVATGESGEITVTVRNKGRSTLSRVRLEVNSTIPNMLVTPLAILTLEPEETATFMIRVSPNIDMTEGDYLIYIQAVSEETGSSVRSLVVSVVSAIPWFWITIGITVIATALAVIAIMKVISKYGVKVEKI